MAPKLVAVIAAASLTTGWLLASIVSPPVAELQGLPQRAERSQRASDTRTDRPYTEQLHLKLQRAPLAPRPRRNPFVFGSVTRPAESRERPAASESPRPRVDAMPAPVITGPSLILSGIGSTETEKGAVRTAVISDGNSVHLAKVGETVGGYAVVDITDETVTIENAVGARWLLRLK